MNEIQVGDMVECIRDDWFRNGAPSEGPKKGDIDRCIQIGIGGGVLNSNKDKKWIEIERFPNIGMDYYYFRKIDTFQISDKQMAIEKIVDKENVN